MISKFQHTLNILKERIYAQRAQGNLLLPGERDLITELNTSRSTLRKVLKQLENEKLVYREKRATKIYAPKKQKYRYAYVVCGHIFSQSFWHQIYYLSWTVFQHQAQSRQFEVELLLLDPEEHSSAEIKEAVSRYDLLFITTIPQQIFDTIKSSGKHMVLLDPLVKQEGNPLITLDNTKVGQLAAQILKDAGSKRVAVIYNKPPGVSSSVTHQQIRAEAFVKEGKKLKLEIEEFSFPTSFWRYVEVMHHYTSLLPERGFDGLFVTSDGKIELIVSDILERKLCPDNFNLLACATDGEAGKCFTPINALAMDYCRLAAELLKIIQLYEQDQYPKDYPPVFLPPIFQKGKTLRNPVTSIRRKK